MPADKDGWIAARGGWGKKNAVIRDVLATPKLIDICCAVLAMEAGGAGLLFIDFGVDQRVHAGVLQRREESVREELNDDQPNRSANADGGKSKNHCADEQRVGYKNGAVAEACENFRHRNFQAHRSDGLRHHQRARLDRREAESHLIQQRK